jgi:hypothetical protein
MMRYEHGIDIDAPPAVVHRVMTDVERWHEWTPSIISIRLVEPGPLRVGSSAWVRQPKLPPARWTVTELQEGRGFTWVSRGPGILVTGRHVVTPRGAGSRAVLSVEYRGVLGSLLGRMTGTLNDRYIALEAEGLKRRSEAG